MRHGMTVAELARLFNEHHGIGAELEVFPMQGWSREMYFDDTDVPWVMPSPNMPTLDTAIVYPGTVLFEGTMLSEGRGTTRPFELIGAPWLDGDQLASRMNDVGLPGVHFRPAGFEPTFQKHARVPCGGCQIHVTSRVDFEPVKTGVSLLRECFGLAPKQFKWRDPPYEYEHDKMPIDILAGSAELREQIKQASPARGDRRELGAWRRRLRGEQKALSALLRRGGCIRTLFRQHRAAECLLERLGQILLGVGADIEAAILVSEAFHVEDALLACPGKILHAEANDVIGEMLAAA
jgi:uncharacterized protein YbbC (DUF1343 family)